MSHPATPTPVSAPRVDLYGPIHQTLRAAMARTLVALGSLDVTDLAECQAVLSSARQLLKLMDGHLAHEETFVHPVLQVIAPDLVADTELEHAQHRTAMAMLAAEIDALNQLPDAAAAQGLYRRFALFVAENHEHMHLEETQLNAALWSQLDDPMLMAIHDRIVGSIPPDEMAATLPLMLPALSPQQRAGMLGAMQAQMPPDAMRGVLDIAEWSLEPCAFAKLRTALGVGLATPA